MKRGKFEAPRKRNPFAVFFWIILIVFLVLGTVVVLKSCDHGNDAKNLPPETLYPGSQETPGATTASTAEPTTEPVTAPPTEPSTEPPTEPTEPVTEPTTVPTEPEQTDPPDNTVGLAVVAAARSVLGKPYASGGAGPDSFDTSGLVNYCFRENSISVPRQTSTLFAAGEAVAKEDLQPGDVVFFYQTTPGKAEYLGIYTGEGTFIAVSSSQNAVLERKMTSTYYTEHYVGARRYIPHQTANP